MTLTPGTHLGSYEIVSLIGAGGMGEAYRARDPRLNRVIAIKVLPEATATDPDRRARFEREAQSLAALNHPNIVTIYSVEDADGGLFLTMEYVEGKPLSDLIVRGGLPLTQILTLAIPLADGVSAAHRHGITHRDLKPSNVIVSADGRIKVVDFGLAKLLEAPSVDSSLTRTVPLTGEGRIVGTVAYMSPEQAEGKPLDTRSDIFSLGVILYEIATGERPFKGESSRSTLTSILRDTPRLVTDLNHALPRDLTVIVRRCLTKDPEHRTQSAKDLRSQLEDLKHDLDSGQLGESQASASTASAHRSRGRTRLWWGLTAAAVLLALSLAVVAAVRPSTKEDAVRFAVDVPLNLTTTAFGYGNSQVAVSPDGRRIAFVGGDARRALWVRALNDLIARPLLHPCLSESEPRIGDGETPTLFTEVAVPPLRHFLRSR